MFKCSWRYDSLLQAALQGTSSMHLWTSLFLLLQLVSWEERIEHMVISDAEQGVGGREKRE